MKTSPIVIFCDQVRQEVGNKFSIMGIYDEQVLVEPGTTIVPQLSVYIRMDSQDILGLKAGIKIKYLDNDTGTDFESLQPLAASSKHVNMVFNISPLRVKGRTSIEVFMCSDASETLIASMPVTAESATDMKTGNL